MQREKQVNYSLVANIFELYPFFLYGVSGNRSAIFLSFKGGPNRVRPIFSLVESHDGTSLPCSELNQPNRYISLKKIQSSDCTIFLM